MSDTNCPHTAHPDWNAECNRLRMKLRKQCEETAIAKAQVAEQSKTITYLEGQIRAFEFCVTKGGVDNGK